MVVNHWDDIDKSLENNFVHLIAGNHDYGKGIKTIEKLLSDPNSHHFSLAQNQKQTYEKRSQTKFFIALVQLVHCEFKCVFCSQNILPTENVILSHNLGHNHNLNKNKKVHNIDEIIPGETAVATFKSLLKGKHYLYSIIHQQCNHEHFEKYQDDFEIIKKNMGNVYGMKFEAIYRGQNSLSYWFSSEIAKKLIDYFKINDENFTKQFIRP